MVQPTAMNVCFRWLDKARICGANPPGCDVVFFRWRKVGFLLAFARVPKVKGCFAPLALQADGRDGIQQFCSRNVCKVTICFARFAAQTLLASNFCLARQKSPKSRLKERGYSAGITMALPYRLPILRPR